MRGEKGSVFAGKDRSLFIHRRTEGGTVLGGSRASGGTIPAAGPAAAGDHTAAGIDFGRPPARRPLPPRGIIRQGAERGLQKAFLKIFAKFRKEKD